MTIPMTPETIVHRVGGGGIQNLRLGSLDAAAIPPGLSVLAGGTPHEAAAQLRAVFNSRKWTALAGTVGSATVGAIQEAGFDVIEAKTTKLPNHARIVHPDGLMGFTEEN